MKRLVWLLWCGILSCGILPHLSSSGVARAQPMMVDPSRMSGIPRPDPQVPAHTVTVRLIRGELANRLTGVEVELVDKAAGTVRKEKTDENGRATFAGLSGGPFEAHAVIGDEELSSQPIELPPAVGVRVMLVFKPGAGTADGAGHSDKTIAPGTVIVRALDGEGAPLPALDVVLGQARAGESAVVEHKAKTDAKGEARFTGLDAKPSSGYLAEVLKDGARYAGKPFRLVENMGSLVVIEVRPVSKDLSALQMGPGSHLIIEIADEAVQVIEVWRISNTGTTAVEVKGGIHFPLPDKAVQASVGQDSPPSFSVSGHEAVWKGPLPVGDTQLQVMFVLAYSGDSVELLQRTIIPFSETAIVTENIAGYTISGPPLEREDRELQGRKLVLMRGPGTTAGGELRLKLSGLPHGDPTWRYLAAALTVLLLVGFSAYARGGDGGASAQRRKLEKKREHMLDELVALGEGDDARRKKKREELTTKLAELYRELDEVVS